MSDEEIEKKAKKYSVYAERFSRGLVGAGNVKVAMMSAYRRGLEDGSEFENEVLTQQIDEMKKKITDLIYNDADCLDKIIELLDDGSQTNDHKGSYQSYRLPVGKRQLMPWLQRRA